MIRAVLDANVYASGVLGLEQERSTPGAIMRSWMAHSFELITSDPLIAEIERTLADPYFSARVSNRVCNLTVTALRQQATCTEISVVVSGVASHPEDDLVLAAAISARADYLVTGDRKLQALNHLQGVRIISPRAFLTLLEQEPNSGQ